VARQGWRLIAYFVHREGRTGQVDALAPEWLQPDSTTIVWVDVRQPAAEDAAFLERTFRFHPLALEDALQPLHYPKVESYGSYLYVILHGIDFKQEEHGFETLDVDFFVGRNYLVTVHDGRRRSIAEVASVCERSDFALAEGPVALMHRIVDHMVDDYRPEVDELEAWLDDIEERVFTDDRKDLTKEILAVKRDISALRRVVVPQRDVVGRLARREFDLIGQEHAYRFRDVYDQLVRLTDEAIMFQDRVTGILDAHLASVSNQLALVSKVLAGIAVIFGPLTVFTGMFGMNVALPGFPGGERVQFWWIIGVMGLITAALYLAFRRRKWL
jgi:magnesium transporter